MGMVIRTLVTTHSDAPQRPTSIAVGKSLQVRLGKHGPTRGAGGGPSCGHPYKSPALRYTVTSDRQELWQLGARGGDRGLRSRRRLVARTS